MGSSIVIDRRFELCGTSWRADTALHQILSPEQLLSPLTKAMSSTNQTKVISLHLPLLRRRVTRLLSLHAMELTGNAS